jgi:hypothetical protein
MADIIVMSQKEADRIPILTKLEEKKITNATAGKMLRLSIRQVQRLKKRFKDKKAAGLVHRSRGQPGHNRLPEKVMEKAGAILIEHYHDFGPTLACEKLAEGHALELSKETVRQIMIGAGLWIPKHERLKAHYRSWRERKEHYGEMEQYDGSQHDWFEGRLPACTLLLAIDDATGKVTHARFASDEGIQNTFLFWREYLQTHGKPLNIYLDRLSTYKINIGEAKDDPTAMTEFQRAMEKDLGIKIIHARSPEAKGRVERVFQTWQDRLPKEMRLAQINTLEDANQFLTKKFIPAMNAKFAVVAKKPGDIHRLIPRAEVKPLDSIMSVQTSRKVNNDFTVSLRGQWYQLAASQPTLVLKKDMVLFEEHLDGTVHIKKGRYLLNFTVLPERPKKIVNLKIAGLSKSSRYIPKPPSNHPWRKPFLLKSVEVLAHSKLPVTNQG